MRLTHLFSPLAALAALALIAQPPVASAQDNKVYDACPLTSPAHLGVNLTFPGGETGWFAQEGSEGFARNVGDFTLKGTKYTLIRSVTWGPRAYLGQPFKWEITAGDDAGREVRITIWSSCDRTDVDAGFIMARYKVSGAVVIPESNNARVKVEPIKGPPPAEWR
ncbi:MAG: hypothetical protein IPN01_12610 [Deltaproteobacteria bacterium]|nr:hypothetical protein [Deltaproteobacteria bacterium]